MAIIYCMFIHQYIHINIESILSSFSRKKFHELYSWRLSIDIFKELLNYKKNQQNFCIKNRLQQEISFCKCHSNVNTALHRVEVSIEFFDFILKKILFDSVYQNCWKSISFSFVCFEINCNTTICNQRFCLRSKKSIPLSILKLNQFHFRGKLNDFPNIK